VDRLDALRAFVLTVDLGSLAAAARRLRRSPAAITRAIASIEDRLGEEMLRRTTRSLRPTEAGEAYLVVARRVLADLDEADKNADVAKTAPEGALTVTAPLAFGAMYVRPLVETYLAAHEGVRVRLLLLDRIVHVVDEGIDVAVRIGALPDSALVAMGIGEVRRVLVASPRYLGQRGVPRAPADLAAHRCVSFSGVTPGDIWSFGASGGARSKQVKVRPALTVNLAEAAVAAAVADLGVTSVLSYQVAAELRTGRLVRLMRAFDPPPLPVQLVYTASSARSAKIRAFVELAAPRLRSALTEVIRSLGDERAAKGAKVSVVGSRRSGDPPRRDGLQRRSSLPQCDR